AVLLRNLKLDQVESFMPGVAEYLSEPKPQAIFTPPEDALDIGQFKSLLSKQALVPHPQTRLLALGKTIFCNGDDVTLGQTPFTQKAWQSLAAKRLLKGSGFSASNPEDSLFEAYLAGWLIFAPNTERWL
ncbi:MAG: hypothetical protein B7Z19_06725, partial [Polynucleobacter sp. 32-46-5]